MIRPISPGGVLPNEATAPTEVAPTANPAYPESATAGAAERTADPLAKFGALFGAPPQVQRFYADANGASGSHQTKARAKADPLVGVELPGQKGVVIQRSFGDTAGYATKNHALAWARAAGSDRAMVVLGKDKRWHAVETSVVGRNVDSGTGAIKTAIAVGKVDPVKYESLKQEAMKNNDPAKWKTFAAYALGLQESEIEIVRKGETPSSTKVNINLSPDFNAEGKTAGFDPNRPAWVQLGPAAFDRPANAAATLAHEEVHAEHRRMTGELYAKYQDSPHGRQSFREWAATHSKDWRMVDIVAGYEDGTSAATELEAHVEAARVAFSSGDLVQARTDLNKVATLPNMPIRQTQDVSIKVLEKLRDGLPTDARAVFDEVAKKARSGNVLKGL